MSSKPTFVNLESTKDRKDPKGVYSSVIAQIEKDGVCPFCRDELAKYHKNPILVEGTHWLATKNMYPYKGSDNHFLLIHKNHISHIEELSAEAWQELKSIYAEIAKQFSIPGGSFLMRFGDSRSTGASVTHLHAHIISSKPETGREPILARVG